MSIHILFCLLRIVAMTNRPLYYYKVSELRDMVVDSITVLHYGNTATALREIKEAEELLDKNNFDDIRSTHADKYSSVFLLETMHLLKRHQELAGKNAKIPLAEDESELMSDFTLSAMVRAISKPVMELEAIEKAKEQKRLNKKRLKQRSEEMNKVRNTIRRNKRCRFGP